VEKLQEIGYSVIFIRIKAQHRMWRRLSCRGHICQTMPKRSTCLNNTACETLFDQLKAEIVPSRQFPNEKELTTFSSSWEDCLQLNLKFQLKNSVLV